MRVLSPLNVSMPYGKASGIRWVNTLWHLAAAGAQVELLAGVSPPSAGSDVLAFYGLKPHPGLALRTTPPLPLAALNRSSTLRARAYFVELLRRIRAFRPRVLYGTGMANHMQVIGAFKRWIPFRVVLELHEDHASEAGRRACLRLSRGPRPVIDGIVTTSQAHRRILIEAGVPAHRVLAVYAGNRPELIPHGERRELLGRLGLPIESDDLIVLYGGNLYGDRGVEDLLLAFQQVAEKVPKAHLVVLGAGDHEMESRCRALVEAGGTQPRIHFMGQVAPSTVGHYLAVADLGVIPNPARNQWDYSCPIKLSEYLGAGLAVVATELTTIKEVVGPEQAALLVPPESPREMAGRLIELLTDEDLRLSMQRRALKAGAKLTYKARAERVYQFFHQLEESH